MSSCQPAGDIGPDSESFGIGGVGHSLSRHPRGSPLLLEGSPVRREEPGVVPGGNEIADGCFSVVMDENVLREDGPQSRGMQSPAVVVVLEKPDAELLVQ